MMTGISGEAGMAEAARFALSIAVTAALLSGCAPTTVHDHGCYSGARLTRPDVVLVREFAVTPEEVRLDRGISAKVESAVAGGSATEQEIAISRQVARAIATALAAEINKLGLPAQTSDAPVEAAWDKRLL